MNGTWHKCYIVCKGNSIDPGWESIDWMSQAGCLGMFVGFDDSKCAVLARIIDRHFSDRCMCPVGDRAPSQRVIHFNNHPDTSVDDVKKVWTIFNEEQKGDD